MKTFSSIFDMNIKIWSRKQSFSEVSNMMAPQVKSVLIKASIPIIGIELQPLATSYSIFQLINTYKNSYRKFIKSLN